MDGPGRAEIARAVPAGSRRVCGRRIERTYLDALVTHPEMARLRADARDNTVEVAKQLARRASYADGTTRRGKQPWHALAGVCKSTWKAARRRLEIWGFLGLVLAGTTSEFSPGVLRDKDAPNVAAVYVLAIPAGSPVPDPARRITRPPTRSSLLDRRDPPREPLGKTPKGPAFGRAPHQAAAFAAAAPLADLVSKAAGQRISDGWCAHIARPFFTAGWSAADVVWALEHDPAGPRHHFTEAIRHAAGWARSRLARWIDETGRPLISHAQQLAVSRLRYRTERAKWKAAAAAAAAQWTDPAPHAANIRAALGWRKQASPAVLPSTRGPKREVRRTNVEFYDSTTPSLIPEGGPACLYYDGIYAANPMYADRFKAVRWITVVGGEEAARHAGIIDFEPGNPAFDPDALHNWAAARDAMKARARIYCDVANLHLAIDAVGDLPRILWIPTLDGVQRTLEELVAWVAERGEVVDPAHVWACQFAGGPTANYDTSVLYGAW